VPAIPLPVIVGGEAADAIAFVVVGALITPAHEPSGPMQGLHCVQAYQPRFDRHDVLFSWEGVWWPTQHWA
jgi:hypothetical protein